MDDFDIEMGDAVDVPMEETQIPDILPIEDQQEEGEVDEPVNGEHEDPSAQRVVPNKIHLRGLDTLNSNHIKAYVAAHFGGNKADRIEWIDDHSANLLFSSDATAQEALVALSAVDIADPTQLLPLEVLPAKTFAENPDSVLQVRFAVESDKKQPGAAQRSRFYLFNPDWDPETEEGRRRRAEDQKRRYRDRDDEGYGRSRSGGGRDRRGNHYDDEPRNTFDVNLYDDDADALATRAPRAPRAHSHRDHSQAPSDRSTKSDRLRTERNKDKELFPDRRPRDALRSERGTYARNRSASPTRDDDGDQAMKDLAKDREAVRNRDKARSLRDRLSNNKRESNREVIKDNSVKELFPGKARRESRKPQMDQISPADEAAIRFSDRVTAPSNGINIRGLATQTSSNQGIAIKGTSVRELFPHKFGGSGGSSGGGNNSGKELFADKLEGRGGRRQRAEDLFL